MVILFQKAACHTGLAVHTLGRTVSGRWLVHLLMGHGNCRICSKSAPSISQSRVDGKFHSPPDSRTHVAAASGKDASRRTGGHRDDRVLVALQHELSNAGMRIPELDTAILGAAEHPVAVGREGNTEHKILTR